MKTFSSFLKNEIKKLPSSPGVYQFLDGSGEVLYVGKAHNLKARVKSYFHKGGESRPLILAILPRVQKIKIEVTNSDLEAILLEAKLIKSLRPKANLAQKDDKSFLRVGISKGDFPRVIFIREKEIEKHLTSLEKTFGPYPSSSQIKKAMRFIRRIIPYRDCTESKFRLYQLSARPCLFGFLKLCPAPCVGRISKVNYQRQISFLKDFLEGKIEKVALCLETEMQRLASKEQFEEASRVRDNLKALEEVAKISLLEDETSSLRIEGFDISNIFGNSAVGVMVVFKGENFVPSLYRKFRIKTLSTPDDLRMLQEVLERRLARSFGTKEPWPLPDLWIIDGGETQLKIARSIRDRFKLNFPIIAIAKGPERKKADLYYHEKEVLSLKESVDKLRSLASRVRDEAHRFAISYHRKLRSQKAWESELDNIPGIGPKTKRKLLFHFRDLEEIKKAPLEALQKVIGKSKAKILASSFLRS